MNVVTTTTEIPYVSGRWPDRCDRYRADGDCWRAFTDYDLTCLLQNLAIAGALTRSFRLGDLFGWDMAFDECMCGWHRDDDNAPVRPEAWSPNAKGKAAP